MANIKGVEIFAVGVWNGFKVTQDMLSKLVDTFNSTNASMKPVLKLGHDDEQKLLQADGYPAAGWVEKVYIKGSKLLADFSDIPQKIADLIKKKAYRKVSVEIFNGVTMEGKKHDYMLGAVALLGADTPAVLSLADIPTDFSKSVTKQINFASDDSSSSIKKNQFDFIPGEIKTMELQKIVDDQKKKLEALESQVSDFKKQNEDIESYKAKINELEASVEKSEIEKFCLSLEQKDLISPSMKPFVLALFEKNKLEFSINDKKFSKQDVLENLLKLAKEVSKISTDEKTKNFKKEGKTDSEAQDELHEKILKYSKDNNVSYRDAYAKLVKE